MTDEAILALATAPETREAGFREIVIRYQQRLYHIIRRQVPTHEDADDILQDTFIKVFRHLDGFRGESGLFTWMYRIATNEVFNFQKKQHRFRTDELSGAEGKTAEHYLETQNLEVLVEQIIQTLPQRQQMVFRMRYYDELSYKEIAEQLQLSEGALKASFHHASRKVEEELKARQII